MKLIFVEQHHKCPRSLFFLKPDTALLRNNQPFFYPDFTNDLRANLSLVLRINRLGRSISERFAARYFDAVGMGFDLVANDLLETSRTQGLPWEPARSFDYAAPISPEFIAVENIDIHTTAIRLLHNNTEVVKTNLLDFPYTFEQIIAHISKFITLKIGDYIYIDVPAPVVSLKIGDELTAFLGEKEMLKMAVK